MAANKLTYKVSLITKPFKKGLDRVRKQSAGFVKRLKSIFSGINKLIFGPLSAGVVAIGAGFRRLWGVFSEGANQFIELESAFADINSLIDGPGGLTKSTKKFIREQAKLYGTSAVSNAKAYYDIVSAGITDQVQAMKVLNTANKIAITGNVAVSESVGALLSVMKSYGEETISAAEAGNILQTVVNKGRTTWSEMSQYISVVAGDAKAAGVQVKELAAMFAILTEKGLDTGRATTSIRGMLNILSKGPGPEAKKVMDELGVSFDLQTAKAKGFAQTLGDLLKKTEGNAALLSKIFPEMEARTGAAQMSYKRWMELTKEFGDTQDALNNAMIDKLSTIESKLKRIDAIVADAHMSKEFAESNLQLKRMGMHLKVEMMPLLSKLAGKFSKAALGFKMVIVDVMGRLKGDNRLEEMLKRMRERDKAIDDPNYKSVDQQLKEKEDRLKKEAKEAQEKLAKQTQNIADAHQKIKDLTIASVKAIERGVDNIRKKTLEAINNIKQAFFGGASIGGLGEAKKALEGDDTGMGYYRRIREKIKGPISGQAMAQIAQIAAKLSKSGEGLSAFLALIDKAQEVNKNLKAGDLSEIFSAHEAGVTPGSRWFDRLLEELKKAIDIQKEKGAQAEAEFSAEAQRKLQMEVNKIMKESSDKNLKASELMKKTSEIMKKAVEEHRKVVNTPIKLLIKGDIAKFIEQKYEKQKRLGTAGPGVTGP